MGEPFNFSENFEYRKNLCIKGGGGGGGEGVSQCSVEKLLSHTTEKIRRGSVLCFRKIGVSKHFVEKRGRAGEGVSRFSVETFLSHRIEPKNFVGEPFCVSEAFWYQKILWMKEGGGVSRFSVEMFCLTLPENFVGEPFLVSKNSGIESFHAKDEEGQYCDLPSY